MSAQDAPIIRDGAHRNRPAQAAQWCVMVALACFLSFATGLGWLYAPFFLTVAGIGSLGAIVTGHVGRARRYPEGRLLALVCIVLGWLGLILTVLAVLLHLGLLVALAAVLAVVTD